MNALLIRPCLCVMAVTCWLAPAVPCFGEREGSVDYFAIPVQNYAFLDISASSTGGRSVELMAIDDGGNVSFCYDTSDNPGDPSNSSVCKVKKWKGGQLSDGATLRQVIQRQVHLTSAPYWAHGRTVYPATHGFRWQFLNADGALFGTTYWHLEDLPPGHSGEQGSFFRCTETPAEGASPPLFLWPHSDVYSRGAWEIAIAEDSGYGASASLEVVSSQGKTAGSMHADISSRCIPGLLPSPPEGRSYLVQHPNDSISWTGETVFDSNDYINYIDSNGASTPQQTCVPDLPDGYFFKQNIFPYLMNNNGWMLGDNSKTYEPSPKCFLYDAEKREIHSLNRSGMAINDSNDVIATGDFSGTGTDNNEAYLLEQGQLANKKFLMSNGSGDQGLIPSIFQSELRLVYPYAMSNRITGLDPAINPPQPILSIIFKAEVRRSVREDKWEVGNFLLRKFSDGSTDLHEIAGLENKRVTGINTSGLIAAIGDPDGDTGPTAVRDALLLVPATSIEIFKPATSTEAEWQDSANRQNWFDPLGSEDSLKLKVKFPIPLPPADGLKFSAMISAYRHGYAPDWKETNLDSDDRLSPSRTEIWMTARLPSLPAKEGTTFCSYESAGSSNFNDSEAFESGMAPFSAEKAGVPVRLSGNWTSLEKVLSEGAFHPWTGSATDENLKMGGTAYVEVQGPAAKGVPQSTKGLVQEQADWFYYSGHGLHDPETIGAGSPASAMDWHKGMNTVFIAGCSILDINNYNKRKHEDTGVKPTNSPGLTWSLTGPKHFLGYNWTAPVDNQDGDAFTTSKIIAECLSYIKGGMTPEDSWMLANLHAKNVNGKATSTNACAISNLSGSGNRVYYYIRERKLRGNYIVAVPESKW